MRVLSTQEPMCRTGGMPVASQTSRKPGPGHLERRLGQQVAGLAAGDRAAAGLNQQDVILEQFAHQVIVGGILRTAGVVAADVGDHTPDASRHDGVVQRAEGSPVGTAEHVVDVLVGEAGNDIGGELRDA